MRRHRIARRSAALLAAFVFLASCMFAGGKSISRAEEGPEDHEITAETTQESWAETEEETSGSEEEVSEPEKENDQEEKEEETTEKEEGEEETQEPEEEDTAEAVTERQAGPETETTDEPAEGAATEAETEQQAEPEEENGATAEAEPEENSEPARQIRIISSQGPVVTEGEIIYLTGELIGFEGLNVSYQWQVDRGDGAGWTDVEGAVRSRHMFVASRETIEYSWRLIVHILEQ